MIVCKIITDFENEKFPIVFNKLNDSGDYFVTKMGGGEDVLFYASNTITQEQIIKIFNKAHVPSFIKVFDWEQDLSLDCQTNQWIRERLNAQHLIKVEQENQIKLKEIDQRLDQVNDILDRIISRQETNGTKGILPEEIDEVKKALGQQ